MSNDDRVSARAEHGDRRFEEREQKYGDLAELTVEELQRRAEEEGIKGRSDMRKDELIEALSNRGR